MATKKYYAEHKEERAAYDKKYRAEHKEELREKAASRQRKYYAAHKEVKATRERKYYAAHKEAKAAYNKKWWAERGLITRYGITRDDWDAIFVSQNGKCAICGGTPKGLHNKFHVDHDHETGKVRGLLCYPCNSAIGLLKDSPAILRAAAEYLETHA